MVPLLAAVPDDELAAGGVPVVRHDGEVARLRAVPEEGALGRPDPDGQVAPGHRVALLVAARRHVGHLGPLAHEAVGLDREDPGSAHGIDEQRHAGVGVTRSVSPPRRSISSAFGRGLRRIGTSFSEVRLPSRRPSGGPTARPPRGEPLDR